MPNVNSLEYQRTLQKQEKAVELMDIWAAILDARGGHQGPRRQLPGRTYPQGARRPSASREARHRRPHGRRHQRNRHRRNRPHLGGEYGAGVRRRDHHRRHQRRDLHLHRHAPSAGPLRPRTEGGRTLFRLIREEPEEPGTYLDFAWGEHVPYGAVRRDPIYGKLYTPIKEAGVTLYEPHYPHLVPSEYKLYGDGGEEPSRPRARAGAGDVPDWDVLEEGHTFAVGDHFTHDGTEYEVLRAFNKQENWAPPALLNDYYKEVSA